MATTAQHDWPVPFCCVIRGEGRVDSGAGYTVPMDGFFVTVHVLRYEIRQPSNLWRKTPHLGFFT